MQYNFSFIKSKEFEYFILENDRSVIDRYVNYEDLIILRKYNVYMDMDIYLLKYYIVFYNL